MNMHADESFGAAPTRTLKSFRLEDDRVAGLDREDATVFAPGPKTAPARMFRVAFSGDFRFRRT